MSGYEWVNRAGHAWHVMHGNEDPDMVFMGLVIDYGRMDELPAEFGTLDLLAHLLEAELQRPIEVGGGEISVPKVNVRSGPASTTISIAGSRNAVLAAWGHLGELFTHPQLSIDAPPAPATGRIWPENLATYIGANTLTLSCFKIMGTRDKGCAEALLARLAPSACQHRHIMLTNDPYLVGAGWSGKPDYGAAPTRPRRYFDMGRSLLPCEEERVVLSVATPKADAETMVGTYALGLRIMEIFDELGLSRDMSSETTSLPGLTLVTYYKTDRELTGRIRKHILEQLLQPGFVPSDYLVDYAKKSASYIDPVDIALRERLWGTGPAQQVLHHDDVAAAALGASGSSGPDQQQLGTASDLDSEWQALAASGGLEAGAGAASGTYTVPASPSGRIYPDELHPEDISSAAIRRAYYELLQGIHGVLEPEVEEVAQRGGFVVWADPPAPEAISFVMEGCFDPAEPMDRSYPHYLAMDESVLLTAWCDWQQEAGGRWEPNGVMARRWVDLNRLRLGINRDEKGVILLDDCLRYVSLPWRWLCSKPEVMQVFERRGLPQLPWLPAAY